MRSLFLVLLLNIACVLSLVVSPAHTLGGSIASSRSCSVLMATRVHQGDTVQIISGSDKGVSGKVISIDNKKSRVMVEGVNMKSKHIKPMKEGETGRVLKREFSVHISNVKAVDAPAAPPAAE